MHRSALLTLALALAAQVLSHDANAADATASPQTAVQAFYELRIAQLPNGGAPDGPALKLSLIHI